jgi:hypothetical protein
MVQFPAYDKKTVLSSKVSRPAHRSTQAPIQCIVEKTAQRIKRQGHKIEPQAVPKGEMGGAATPLPTGLCLHLYLYLTQTA